MVRRQKGGRIGAKVFATIMSVTMAFSTLSLSVPGAEAFAMEEGSGLTSAETGTAVDGAATKSDSEASTSDSVSEDSADSSSDVEAGTTEADAASTEAGSDAAEKEGESKTESVETSEVTDKAKTGTDEAALSLGEGETAESTAKTSETSAAANSASEANSKENVTEEVVEESQVALKALAATEEKGLDSMVDFSSDSSTSDGIKTTTTRWNFATTNNTGYTTSVGDSIGGIIVGGGSGRVILDSGKDLNVKTNSSAETTGVIYLPVSEDSNVVKISIAPIDSDPSRYVTIGSFDSDVKLIDNKADAENQTVTFKSDLGTYVVNSAAGVEGRFIPLFSHGNFKTASIELVETDEVTIVDVSGSVSGDGVDKIKGLSFKNESTDEITTCDVEDGSFKVSLPNGYRYVVSVTGAMEYAVDSTDDGNILDLSTGNDKEKTRDFALVSQDVVGISGKLVIEKADNANDISADSFEVSMVPAKKTLDTVKAELTKGIDDYHYQFSAAVLPGEEYTVKLTGANDYECSQVKLGSESASETSEKNDVIKIDASVKNAEIEVSAKPLYEVELEAVTHNLKAVDSVTALTVKNLDDSYTYSFEELTGSTLTIKVRDGLYEVTEITTDGSFEPYEHFEVNGEKVSEKMYLKDTSEKEAVSYKAELTVGKSGCDYTTIYDALDAVDRMERSGDERVTIVLKDEYYQEQVVVSAPNVTFESGRENGSTISWYYGLGGDSYYSAYLNTDIDKNHLFYDEAHAVDQYESATIGQTPGNWGSTVSLKSTATGFKAENITFENSFNFYISDAEKADIAESGSILDRKASGADPTAYKSKERACTLYNRGANDIEFYNCRFLSSQDTLYTGDANEYSYFYDCTIEGTTDFICGDGNALFDNCDLVLYGFSDKKATDLVIVASKGSASKGYLFNFCTISTDDRDGIQAPSSAYLGRPWGTSSEKVAFMNTVVDGDLIQAKGWTTMNTVPSLNNGLHEYGTRYTDGKKVDLSGRVATNIGTDKQGTADNYVLTSQQGYTRLDYLSSSWTPSYYGADYSVVNRQMLRYNGATIPSDKKASVDEAYNAVVTGLFADDQARVDGFAKDLKKALDDAIGEEAEEEETENPGGSSEDVEKTEFVLEAKNLPAVSAGDKADGDTEKVGTDNYFTLIYSVKSKIDSSTKTWEDEYTSGQRINFGGAATTEKNAVKFTTSGAATVKVWWVEGGDDNRQMVILDSQGNKAAITEGTYAKNGPYLSTFELESAGTYYLGGATGNNYIFKVEVTEGDKTEEVRKDWNLVDKPVIKKVALNEKDPGKIDVTVSAVVGTQGGDTITAYMLQGDKVIVDNLKSVAEKNEFTFSFVPKASGEYFFTASLSRDDENVILESSETDKLAFVLPLTAPQFKNATNKGNGKVTAKFYSVVEAESYELYATDKNNEKSVVKATVTPEEVGTNTTTEYAYTFTGLTVGSTYVISVVAKRGNDISEKGEIEIEVTSDGETEWVFSAFGQGVSKGSNCGYEVNDDGSVTVWNTGNKGKLVPASTDGLSFYYTAVPADKNFTLTATATIDSWTWTNGQEGFGLMAADRVGVNGNSAVFWNNSYMASGTKVEYYYDTEKNEVTTDTTKAKITMKQGLGSQEKKGVTNENLSRLEANDTDTVTNEFSSTMYPLETAEAANGAGTYNIFAKELSGNIAATTVANPISTVRLRIQKNNTGYFVSYLDENDNVLSIKKYYETDALQQLDSDNVYVGFFASRTFTATFSDIELTTIDPSEDAPAEEKPLTYVVPMYKIISSDYSNTAKYELQYTGNADGTLTITDEKGEKLVNAQEVKADEVTKVTTKLVKGDNKFTVNFVPSEFYLPDGDEYKRLSSYEAAEFTHTVKYQTINSDEKIYVTPDGDPANDGTSGKPVDIYTAVKYVQPGQTIVLAAGTYSLETTVTVDRGIDGTPSKPIKMITDGGRAIFDFNSKCAGFVFAGDYWYINGIDCTKSSNGQKGIQVSGSHITLEDVRTYENGNTGIQISRFLSSDAREEWPSYDLILNCTSYSNADSGYEDADGFAAKLTCGDGIVFDGCISYNNADDGWDLFAKVESGSIGQVTIRNCVAFSNGYGVDGTNEGNGNGFKMGGSSMSGPHKLINSAAWGNKAKGIDSNSGPDIQVYNSMSFNNGSNNVALYTNDAANTDYLVEGVLSYRTEGTSTNENLKPKGSQDTAKIYGKNNFFWQDGQSANSEGLVVTDDWFVSLDAPKASASDPYAVAESLRGDNGSVDLGDFLKLTDKAFTDLSSAGLDAKEVTADLGGDYEAVTDEREIGGSAEDAKGDEEADEDDPEDPENPDNPDNPDDPENPDNPDNPDDPENPDNPDNPDDPQDPDEPDEPSPVVPTPVPIPPVVVKVVKVVTTVVKKVVTGILKGLSSIFRWF